MTVSKEIMEKVRKYAQISKEAEKLHRELMEHFREDMDGAYMEDFWVTDEVSGEDQGAGEYCDQGGNPDTGYSGNYFYPTETGEYVAISYTCW